MAENPRLHRRPEQGVRPPEAAHGVPNAIASPCVSLRIRHERLDAAILLIGDHSSSEQTCLSPSISWAATGAISQSADVQYDAWALINKAQLLKGRLLIAMPLPGQLLLALP